MGHTVRPDGTIKTNNRGGSRPNSGRKPATEKRINHTVRLNTTEAELVKTKYGSLANLVRTAIG